MLKVDIVTAIMMLREGARETGKDHTVSLLDLIVAEVRRLQKVREKAVELALLNTQEHPLFDQGLPLEILVLAERELEGDADSVDYRICTNCEIHHYENCHTCFGFGVYQNEDRLIPITTADAHGQPPIYADYVIHCPYLKYAIPCPECGSTLKGLPDGRK